MGRFRPPFNKNKYTWSPLIASYETLQLKYIRGLRQFRQRGVLLFLLALPTAAVARELLDRLAAEVNSEPILYSEIQEKVTKGPKIQVSEFPASQGASDYEKALQDAINLRLIRSYTDQIELLVNEEDVQQHLERLKKHYSISEEELRHQIEMGGKSYSHYLKDVKDQILLARFQGRVIMPGVKVTDKDILAYYLRQNASKPEAVVLQLRRIVIPLPGQPGDVVREAKLRHASAIYQKLKGGMNFSEARQLYSEHDQQQEPSEFRLNELNQSIRNAVAPLSPGQFTAPLEISGSIYLFYLEDKKVATDSDFEQRKEAIAFELRQREAGTQLTHWLKEERLKNKIRIIN